MIDSSINDAVINVKVKVKVRTLDIAPLRGTPPQKRSGTDHTVLPANFTVPASVALLNSDTVLYCYHGVVLAIKASNNQLDSSTSADYCKVTVITV